MLQVILKNLLGLIKYSEIQNHQKKNFLFQVIHQKCTFYEIF